MKKAWLILSAALFINICAIAPAAAEMSMELKEFYGGDIALNMSFNSEFLYGSRGDGLRQGGAVSTLDNCQSVSSYNPAMLAFLGGGYGSLGLYPVSLLSSDVAGFFMGQSVGSLAGEGINAVLSDAADGLTITAGVDFSVNTDSVKATASQSTGFTNVEIVVPFAGNQSAIGFARESKNFLEITGMITGLEAMMTVSDSDTGIDIDVRAKMNALADISSSNVVTTWGVGRRVTEELGVGVVLEHYDSLFEANGRGAIDGTATYAGTTMQLNTSEDNSLEQYASGNLYGEAWGIRFGGSLHLANHSAELGLDCGVEPQIQYSGDTSVIYHTIPDSIDISDFTRTKRVELDGTEGTLKIKIPSFIRGTFAFKAGLTGVINYTHYFDGFSYTWEGQDETDELNISMLDDVRLGVSFSIFQLGLGVVYTHVSTVQDDVVDNIYWGVMPLLSAGVTIPIDRVKLEIDLFAFPLVVLKTAATYQF
ncbi:MAG: hypothetical protein LLG37_04635 [Spirochaetia bacterium]|nr:hypothetical protein [Spirochaetia bacterium]